MIIKPRSISEVLLITNETLKDERGLFRESFNFKKFKEQTDIDFEVVQQNYSESIKGVFRGFHFQKAPYDQAKIVFCLKGIIKDFAVDIRRESATFGKYVSEFLSNDGKCLYIPRGFAHGFLALSDCKVLYLTDHEYIPSYDAGVNYHDAVINIRKPDYTPLMSEKDMNLPFLKELYEDI